MRTKTYTLPIFGIVLKIEYDYDDDEICPTEYSVKDYMPCEERGI